MPETAKKIISYNEVVRFQDIKNGVKENQDALRQFDELSRKMREILMTYPTKNIDSHLNERIMELEKENDIMRSKLKIGTPIHIITYLIINSLVMGASACLLILRYVFKIYIVDPYYVICAFLISATLFATAIAAIKDWKEFLNER